MSRKLKEECINKVASYMLLHTKAEDTKRWLSNLRDSPNEMASRMGQQLVNEMNAKVDEPSYKNIDTELKAKIHSATKRALDTPENVMDMYYSVSDLPQEILESMVGAVVECECDGG